MQVGKIVDLPRSGEIITVEHYKRMTEAADLLRSSRAMTTQQAQQQLVALDAAAKAKGAPWSPFERKAYEVAVRALRALGAK